MKDELVKSRDITPFERVVTSEINSLVNLTKSIKTVDFCRCVDMMAEADRICIIGCMASSCLANFFGYILAKIFPRVDVIEGHNTKATAICSGLNPESLVFLISFPRYPRATFDLGRFVAQKGAKIIAITNSSISPIVPLANFSFFIPVGILSFADTYAAPMAFITAIVTELSERNPDITQKALRRFDEYASKMDLFLKSRVGGRSRGRSKDTVLQLDEFEKGG
jgi:DNA-binding MurR/RpiR family transcriptional regulator